MEHKTVINALNTAIPLHHTGEDRFSTEASTALEEMTRGVALLAQVMHRNNDTVAGGFGEKLGGYMYIASLPHPFNALTEKSSVYASYQFVVQY